MKTTKLSENFNNEPKPLRPYDIEAEMAVLGAMMLGDSGAADIALELLTPADFYRDVHTHLFGVMSDLRAEGKPLDTVTLKAALSARDLLDQCGGVGYLMQLGDMEFTTANIAYYAAIVRDKSTKRRLIDAAYVIAGRARQDAEPAETIQNLAEQAVYECGVRSSARQWQTMKQLLPARLDAIEERRHQGTGLKGISTGLERVDRMTGGLCDGDLIILAARASMGKTACATSIARHVAERIGSVAFFSAEMSKENIMDRLISAEAQVDLHRINSGMATDDDWHRFGEASQRIWDMDLFIEDEPAPCVTAIESRARRLRSEAGALSLIVVDYLTQLSPPEGRQYNNEHSSVSAIVQSLKNTARRLKVPVLCLAQLSREVERRSDKRPILSDLRESGKIEEEADVIAFLYRASYYEQKGEAEQAEQQLESFRDEVEFIVGKNRNGPTGYVKVGFAPRFTRFDNLAESPF